MKNGFISIPNLDQWQHYKKRNPPWIKLHRDILNDYEFTRLQDASKAHLMLLWLLASQVENKIPADANWIKSKLYLTEDIDFNSLIEGGFIDGDIGLLARRKQSAVRETETEAEAEREAETCTKENSREVVQPIREARA